MIKSPNQLHIMVTSRPCNIMIVLNHYAAMEIAKSNINNFLNYTFLPKTKIHGLPESQTWPCLPIIPLGGRRPHTNPRILGVKIRCGTFSVTSGRNVSVTVGDFLEYSIQSLTVPWELLYVTRKIYLEYGFGSFTFFLFTLDVESVYFQPIF